MNALAEKRAHIPYRDSKLTRYITYIITYSIMHSVSDLKSLHVPSLCYIDCCSVIWAPVLELR